jgi:hypothetical protein
MLPHPEIRRELSRQRVLELRGAASEPLRLRPRFPIGPRVTGLPLRVLGFVTVLRRRPKPVYPQP